MANLGMPLSEPFRQHLEFVTTAQMAVEARAASGGMTMNTFHFVGDVALIVVGVAFAIVGYVLGYLFVIAGILFLFVSQVAPIQRWLVTRQHGAFLGQPVTVDVDDEGMQFATPLTTSHMPWSTITSLRVSDRSILFYRERTFLGYLPVGAFNSEMERRAFIEHANSRVASRRAIARNG